MPDVDLPEVPRSRPPGRFRTRPRRPAKAVHGSGTHRKFDARPTHLMLGPHPALRPPRLTNYSIDLPVVLAA